MQTSKNFQTFKNRSFHLTKHFEAPKKPKIDVAKTLRENVLSLVDISQLVEHCGTLKEKELILDRALLLCLYTNKLIKQNKFNINDVISLCGVEKFNTELIDENFWMNQKVDKYARSEERKIIPKERWFADKDKEFSDNLRKCFYMNKQSFKLLYEWLYDINDETKIN